MTRISPPDRPGWAPCVSAMQSIFSSAIDGIFLKFRSLPLVKGRAFASRPARHSSGTHDPLKLHRASVNIFAGFTSNIVMKRKPWNTVDGLLGQLRTLIQQARRQALRA